MKKVAVIGESPNDTTSLCEVWNKRYAGKGQFSVFLKRVRGAKLDSKGKMQRLIRTEVKSSDFQLYVFVRDLDGPRTSKNHMDKVQEWYNYLSSITGGGILLTNIQTIEAMILGDIETFNKVYKSTLSFTGNPEMQLDPKKTLKSATAKTARKYTENDCMNLIPKLNFTKVESNCQFYRDFILELDKAIN